ncbi:hypothetical protein P5V15_012877 [Pogonomyrmex californicus]
MHKIESYATYNSDDDLNTDPDYYYSKDTDSFEEENENSAQSHLENISSHNNTKSSLETSLNVSGQKICDDMNLHVESAKPKDGGKRNFCYYCKKMQLKIARHLEHVHKNEEEVKKFLLLPKGNYIFNTNPSYNNGELLVCRRPTESRKRTACDFICCAACKGFFTKNNIRHYFKECIHKTVGRSVKVLGRKVQGRIHEYMIRYDELLIIYGNKLYLKYKHQHQQDMIRSRLRLLGFLHIFFSLYHPSKYDDCITAVNEVAGFKSNTKIYTAPSIASRLGTLLKQIGNLNIAECIKRNNWDEKKNTENFLKLLQKDFSVTVNKTVEESILQAKRYQLQELPSLDDIKLLHNFLQTNRRSAFQRFSDEFTYGAWRQLAQFTLISVQIAKKYVRFLIRGKLGRSVPVLLDCEMKKCTDLLLRYRKEANIPDKNPYIFALPGYDKKRFKYIRACDLLRHYSLECGAKLPLRLRGTKLRKHIATRCITLNLSDRDYSSATLPSVYSTIEIIKMSKLLKIAQGEDQDIEQDIADDNLQINAEDNNFTQNEELQMEAHDDGNNTDDSDTTCGAVENVISICMTKCIRWTEEECNIITTSFQQEMKERRLPSGRQMVEIKMKNKCLNRRTIPQIRSWIHNQIF